MISVLLVDDEAISCEYIRNLIEWNQHGFHLAAEARSVSEALQILEQQPIQIVLSDVYMPEQNGVDLSFTLADRYPHIAMIAISSFDNYEYVRQILKNGAFDYILKHQLNKDSLLQVLQSAKKKLTNLQPNPVLKEEKRQQIIDWIFNSQEYPFAKNKDRVALTIVQLNQKQLDTSLKSTFINSIIEILESYHAEEHKETIAAYYSPNIFIICVLFTNTASESEIQNSLYFRNIQIQDDIKLLYNIPIVISNCPPSISYKSLPSLVHKILQKQQATETLPQTIVTRGLSITVQKALLTALEENNVSAIYKIIEAVFLGIDSEDTAGKLMTTKEFLEILATFAAEHDVKLDFFTEGQQWYIWAKKKSITEILNRVSGLYKQVIYEISLPASLNYSSYTLLAIEYIEKNYESDIGLKDIAKSIGVSASYLSRLYRQETGSTIIEYLNHVRVKQAKTCMRQGMSLKETAFVCGFRGYNYFLKVFKDYEGITPKEFMANI